MPDLLPVGVMACDDERCREPLHAEYTAGSGMDVDFVQMISGNDSAGIEMEPERYAGLFYETDRQVVYVNVTRQRVYCWREEQQILVLHAGENLEGMTPNTADQREKIIGNDPDFNGSPQ